METRIAKKSRFQIVKLEERVAPSAFASATTYVNVSGQAVVSATLSASVNQSLGPVSGAVAGSVSGGVGVSW